MRQRREWLLVPSLLIVGCVAAFAWALHDGRETARRQSEREDQAQAMLRTLEQAQRTHHEQSGRYTWLDELSLPVTRQTDETGAYFEHADYRFDVLLPAKRQMSATVQLATQGAKSEHRELRTKHFVLIARPIDPGISGYRTFYVDETGFVWVNEGVSDEETLHRNPLPVLHLDTSEGKDLSGRVWTRLDTLVPRGQAEWDRVR